MKSWICPLLLAALGACWPFPGQVCEPGQTQSCTCPSGGRSAQACADDGEGWERCSCEDLAPASDASVHHDASGVTDASVTPDARDTPDAPDALDASPVSDAAGPPAEGGAQDAAHPPDARALPDAAADVSGADPSECRLAFSGTDGVGVGFPVPSVRLASTGTVRATMIFVDYPDVEADRTPQQVFEILSPGAEEFFAAVSYGRLQLVLEPHLEWLRLSSNSSVYAAGLTSFLGHRDFIAEAVALADPQVDFSGTDLVVVVSAVNASAVSYGPTWMGISGWEIEVDGAGLTNGITSGTDLLYWGSLWLNHEMGHSMSLPDLYEYGGSGGFTRPFSLMDLISSTAPEPLAWERWQLGWLDDDQVICNPGNVELWLSPIETAGGRKAVMVRTSPGRVLVAESRRALGYDSALQAVGLVVSLVDTSIASGSGPIAALNGQRALSPGESVTLDGVTFEVLAATADGDAIRVTSP